MSRHRIHAELHLQDRQLIDATTGQPIGKVDDVELDLDADPPRITALLSNPSAWGRRLPGRLGRLVVDTHRRLRDDRGAGADRIAISTVVSITAEVHVGGHPARPRGMDAWLDHHLLDHIPGADHETE